MFHLAMNGTCVVLLNPFTTDFNLFITTFFADSGYNEHGAAWVPPVHLGRDQGGGVVDRGGPAHSSGAAGVGEGDGGVLWCRNCAGGAGCAGEQQSSHLHRVRDTRPGKISLTYPLCRLL